MFRPIYLMPSIVVAIITVIFLFSSGAVSETGRDKQPTYGEYLTHSGILGEHALRHPANSSGISGSAQGMFFLFSGFADGKMKTTNNISFSWSPFPATIVSSEFPKETFKIMLDENVVGQPTVEFIFNKKFLKIKSFHDQRDALSSENPNNIISFVKGKLDHIKIRISKADLKNEPALPQL